MNTVRLLIVSALLAVASTHAQSALSETSEAPLHADLGKALGFIMGQRFSLNRIKNKYPKLDLRVQKAELEFKSAFGIAEKNTEKALQDMLRDKYPEYKEKIEKQLESMLSSQKLDQDIAVQFIDEVQSRSKGKIPSPILETLLTYQFKDRPVQEFESGYDRVFSSKEQPKAKGVDFQIRYPTSWRPEEGERPNVIQKFTSENGRGLEMFLIMIKDISLPPGYKLTQEELNEFFSEGTLREMVPDGGRFISAKPILLDNHKGAMVLFDQTAQRLDMTLKMRSLHFITVCDSKMIFIQCMVSNPPGKEMELKERFNLFEPLFKQIANSFVIQGQYN